MEHVLVSFITIMLCGLGAQWVAWRLNIPGIALFLVMGLSLLVVRSMVF